MITLEFCPCYEKPTCIPIAKVQDRSKSVTLKYSNSKRISSTKRERRGQYSQKVK